MAMRAIGILAAMVALVATPVMADERDRTFTVSTVKFVLPLAGDYCPAGGIPALALGQVAKADPQNVTLTEFVHCDDPSNAAPQRYGMIKIPKLLVGQNFGKAELLKLMNQVYTGPGAPKFDAAMEAQLQKGFKDAWGTAPKIAGNYGYMRRDADCIYLGGRLAITTPDGSSTFNGVSGGCLSVVGGKTLAIYLYDFKPDGDIETLNARARAMMLSIKVVK